MVQWHQIEAFEERLSNVGAARSASRLSQLKRETMEGWFLDFLPDLNQHDAEVSRYLIQNTLWWIGTTGLDGIRMDTWQYVPNSFWRDWTKRSKASFQISKLSVR